MGELEGAELILLALHQMRLHRPRLHVALDQRAHVWHDRDDHLRANAAGVQQFQRLAERLHQVRDLGRAAARQHDENETTGVELQPIYQRLRIEVVQPIKPFNQRVSDVGGRRTAEAFVRGWLERQQRQDMIDIGAHFACAPRPPRPHARRHVVDDGDVRRPLADALGDGMRELGGIDDDDGVGLGGDGRIDRAVDARHDARQARQDRQNSHDGDVLEGKLRGEAGTLHVLAADAEEVNASLTVGTKRGHKLAAQRIARMLAGDNEDAQVIAAGGGATLADAARGRCPRPRGAIG